MTLTEQADTYQNALASACVVALGGSDVISSSGYGSTILAGDGNDVVMAGPGSLVRGGSGDDTINGFSGATVFGNAGNDTIAAGNGENFIVPGPGVDTVSGGADSDTIAIFDLCEVERGENLDGQDGIDTLITPVPVEQLVQFGVNVANFENIVVEPNSCKSDCRVGPACPETARCVEGISPGLTSCECLPGFAGENCTEPVATVSGRVVYNGVPVVAAEVRIGDLSEITDENGEFRFLNVPVSASELITRFEGQLALAQKVPLSLTPGEETVFEVKMLHQQAASVQLSDGVSTLHLFVGTDIPSGTTELFFGSLFGSFGDPFVCSALVPAGGGQSLRREQAVKKFGVSCAVFLLEGSCEAAQGQAPDDYATMVVSGNLYLFHSPEGSADCPELDINGPNLVDQAPFSFTLAPGESFTAPGPVELELIRDGEQFAAARVFFDMQNISAPIGPVGCGFEDDPCTTQSDCCLAYECDNGACRIPPPPCDQGSPCSVSGRLGLCKKGTLNCADPFNPTCEQAIFPTTEVCNALDDDCDGTSDNNIQEVGTACVVDPSGCQAGFQTPGKFACKSGGRWSCQANACDTADVNATDCFCTIAGEAITSDNSKKGKPCGTPGGTVCIPGVSACAPNSLCTTNGQVATCNDDPSCTGPDPVCWTPENVKLPNDHCFSGQDTGAPSDEDGDGVIDFQDACPDEAGIPTVNPLTNGCPDKDKDGVVDAEDQCPDKAGSPFNNGCP